MNLRDENSAAVALRLRLWLASAVLLLAALAALLPKMRFDTDLLAMLPAAERDAAFEAAGQRAGESYARRLLFLIGAGDIAGARRAAEAFAAALRAAPAIAQVQLEADGSALQPDAATLAARFGLLSDADRARIDQGELAGLRDTALRELYSPAGLARLTALADDPLGLADRALRAGSGAPGRAGLEAGVLSLHEGDRVQVLVLAQTRDNPFSASAADGLAEAFAKARAAAQAQGATVLGSGVALHALAASSRARQEAGLLGGASTLACAALLFAVFGALRPALLALLSMGYGMLLALVLSQALFGRLHLLTVVFGTSLIGVSLDYAIHFLADQFRRPQDWQPPQALGHIGTAVVMGLATTALGYAAFATAPLPVLRQMAVFSALGLLGAAWTVWMALPALARPAPLPQHDRWLRLAAALAPRRLPVWLWLLLAAATALGLSRVQFSDQLRGLQASPAQLVAEETALRAALGAGFDSRFFMVLAASDEALLQAEEALTARLATLKAAGALGGYRAISRALPSAARQAADRQRVAALYRDGGTAAALLTELGFPPAVLTAQRAALQAGASLSPAALASPRLAPLAPLWLGEVAPGRHASLVTLEGVNDLPAVAAAADGLAGVHWRDPVQEVSNSLQAQREAAISRMAMVYLAMALLLAWRYGPGPGLLTLAAPLGGSALTLAVLAAAGLPLTLFTVLTLLLVLGFGVDYAIFLREGARQSESAPLSSRLAVWLAAATALLSFGSLSFSATPFLRDIGLTLCLGVGFSLLFSLTLAPDRSSP